AGRGSDPGCNGDECDEARLSVLIAADEVWVGVSPTKEFDKLPRTGDGYDWISLERTLARHKASPRFAGKTAIEIAANSTPNHPIAYQALVVAMDIAAKTGFVDVGISDPQGLSAQPML